MKYRKRDGEIIEKNSGQDRILKVLYGSVPGRMMMKALVHPAVSRMGGRFLDSTMSRWLIGPFVEKSGIVLEEYEDCVWDSYNAFFIRRIKEGMRPVDKREEHLISPCDSKLTVSSIEEQGQFLIKNTRYTLSELLRDSHLARKYLGGDALIFRLTVDDYHHYCYIDAGKKSANRVLPGVLHTVNPVANDVYPVYVQNSRQYSLLKSENFGTVLMMEVGALLVGKIVNHHQEAQVVRGQEKGYFQFGGSTVILLFEKGRITVDEDILKNSRDGVETVVQMGEKIGTARK